MHQGKWEASRQSYAEAIDIAESMDPSPYLVAARRGLGQLLTWLDDDKQALSQLRSAMELADAMPSSIERPLTMLAVAECRGYLPLPETRLEMVSGALSIGLPASAVIAAHALLAELCHVLGDSSTAKSSADSAVDLAESFGSSYLLGQARLAQAKQASYTRDQADAVLRHFNAALAYFKRTDSAVGYKLFADAAGDCSARLREIGPRIRELLDKPRVTQPTSSASDPA